MSAQSLEDLTKRLKKLYTTGEYSDLVITCGNDTHQVHKSIVCSGSGFFAGALRFTVGKEASENKINLPEDDPAIVKILIDYLYTADQLLLHAKVYEIGDKYAVSGLKELAHEKFSRACFQYWMSDEFVVAAQYVYTILPDHDVGLQNTVRDTIAAHRSLVFKASVDEMLAEIPGLARDILKKVVWK
ncbi:hypothetical protein N0V90_004983 [Kalmusia sp. IMI 367209]|nr:hypothetical protein N0V90_004983 [Kalmusia sp. IMI 367209]